MLQAIKSHDGNLLKQLLVSKQSEIDLSDALIVAINIGDVDSVRTLLENGANIEYNPTPEAKHNGRDHTILKLQSCPSMAILSAIKDANQTRDYTIIRLLLKYANERCTSYAFCRSCRSGDKKLAIDIVLNTDKDVTKVSKNTFLECIGGDNAMYVKIYYKARRAYALRKKGYSQRASFFCGADNTQRRLFLEKNQHKFLPINAEKWMAQVGYIRCLRYIKKIRDPIIEFDELLSNAINWNMRIKMMILYDKCHLLLED